MRTNQRIPIEFFARGSEEVARELLGNYIVRKIGSGLLYGIVQEVGAYQGMADSSPEFLVDGPGRIHVYSKFGKGVMVITTDREDAASCVTLRGIVANTETRSQYIKGPGNATKFLRTPVGLNDDVAGNGIWFEESGFDPEVLKRKQTGSSNCLGYFFFNPNTDTIAVSQSETRLEDHLL